MYEEGKGCPPSLEEAFEHYGEAARLGSADGHFNRAGILIMTGTDREQLEKAADDLKSVSVQLPSICDIKSNITGNGSRTSFCT